MPITPQQARAELARRELARRGVSLETPPETQSYSPFESAMGKISQTIVPVATAINLPYGLLHLAIQQQGKASAELGDVIAEKGGELGLPTPVNVAAGFAAETLSNPLTYAPAPSFAGRFLKPQVPVARQAAVSAAERIGLPMERAELTGSRLTAGFSNLLEKSPLGSSVFEKFREGQYSALGAEKQRLQGSLGTSEDIFAAGYKSKRQLPKREAVMVAKRNEMFEAIPNDVYIPLNESKNIADDIALEQSKFLDPTKNKDVLTFTSAIQGAETSSGKGVTGGPVKFGERQSVAPEETFAPKSNYEQIKRLREALGQKESDAYEAGRFSEARDFARLKDSLERDIQNFVEQGTDVSKEFGESFRKANAFSGAYKKLFKSEEAASIKDVSSEKIVNSVFRKNNETGIKKFRALVGEDGFLQAKRKFTQDILESTSLVKELDKFEEGTLRAIYSAPELEELRNYALAQSVPKTVPGLQGTSGSARSNVGAAQFAGLGAGIVSLLRGDVASATLGIGQFLVPRPLSKAYLSTSRGVPASLSRGTIRTGVAFSNADINQRRRDLIERFVDGKSGGIYK